MLLRFVAGDSDSADRYPVLLRAKAGGTDYALSSSTQYGESREQAAAVAKLLKLPLVDATTDHESVRDADRVDATLQERLRSGEDASAEAARPLRMQCQVRESSRAVEIVLPGPGFKPGTLIGLSSPSPFWATWLPGSSSFSTGPAPRRRCRSSSSPSPR